MGNGAWGGQNTEVVWDVFSEEARLISWSGWHVEKGWGKSEGLVHIGGSQGACRTQRATG